MFVTQIGIFGLLDKEAFDGQKAVFAFNYNDSTYLLPDHSNISYIICWISQHLIFIKFCPFLIQILGERPENRSIDHPLWWPRVTFNLIWKKSNHFYWNLRKNHKSQKLNVSWVSWWTSACAKGTERTDNKQLWHSIIQNFEQNSS